MINFTDLHRITPFELRITATEVETGRSKVYPIFARKGDEQEVVEFVKARVRKAGLPAPFDIDAHVAGILADAPRYGTE